MILETILFTALPTGRKGSDLFASVLISPQLGGEEGNPKRLPLSRYVDFREGRWTQLVTEMRWEFVLRWSRDDSQEDVLAAERISDDPDQRLFATMFPTDMPVDPFRFANPADAAILSYPAARLDSALDQLQRTVARQSPEIRPRTEELVSTDGGYGKLPLDGFVLSDQRRQQIASTIGDIVANQGVAATPSNSGPDGTALSVGLLEGLLKPSSLAGTLRKPSWPDLDFHQVISLLQSHPNLLRRLGLLVDLRIPITRVRRQTGNPRVYPISDWPPPYDPDAAGLDITTAFPRVSTTLGTDYFRPAPRTDALTGDGFVNLSGARAITSTLESEVLATTTAATGQARIDSRDLTTYGTPDRRGIPARHSAGVEIVRADEPKKWRDRMAQATRNSAALATGDDILLDAEDVLMGYRIDIRRGRSGAWRSLHRRGGVVTPYEGSRPLASIDLGEDEGWSELAASAHPEDVVDGRASVLRMRETLATWTGWSLSLPKPSRALDGEDQAAPNPTPEQAEALLKSMHAVIAYAAPRSGARLPTLRFSTQKYQARVRWVDLAGNSLTPDAAGGSLLEFDYLRHDPVPSPQVYLSAEPVWSETAEVLVLRTGINSRDDRTVTRRWIAPPKSAAFFCLMHGVFDDAQGRPRVDEFATIAERESASLRTRNASGDVVFIPDDPGAVPYLPDPLADGLLIRGLPRSGALYDRVVSIPYRGSWPQVEVAGIIARSSRRNAVSLAGDVLTVDLEPGRVAHLRVSHSLTAEGLNLMDLWRRISSTANASRAREGAYWQLTPDRTVVVVHAVQKPVSAPRFVTSPANRKWKSDREAGQTASTLSGSLTLDQPSTQSIDLIGSRTYAVDDGPGTAAPRIVDDADMGVVGTQDIADPAPGGGKKTLQMQFRAAFSDTRRQDVSVTAEAKSRFAEYFRKTVTASASASPITLNGGNPVVTGSVRVNVRTFDAQGTPTDRVAAESAYTVDAERGVVRIEPDAPDSDRIGPTAVLNISFIPGPITISSTDSSVPARLRQAEVTVPSSARPLAPQVEWILPSFRWEDPTSSRLRSRRQGGSLRVYLARPWFTSGIGEELAVVLRPSSGRRDDARDALVTQWGQDPITVGGSLPTANFPTANSFTNASRVTRGVRLAEMNTTVDIVRYRLDTADARGRLSGFDAERDMWFVDIDIDHGAAYRPFVRLAFARYQPGSVDPLHLSTVTVVDVVQLEPDRLASVAFSGPSTKQTASLTLSGRSYVRNEIGDGPGKAVAILERYDGPTGPKVSPALSGAWTPLQTVTLSGRVSANGEATWTGRLTVDRSRPATRYRIVFEQYEVIRTDGGATAWNRVPASARAGRTGERLVHQDIIPV